VTRSGRIWKKRSTLTTYSADTIRNRYVIDTKDKYIPIIYRLEKKLFVCEYAMVVNDYEATDLKWGDFDFPERKVSTLSGKTEKSTKKSYGSGL
jgi:hypothetical protein